MVKRFPSERFEREAKSSPSAAHAIVEAATELLTESDDLRVLVMVAQLADNTIYRPFYEAVLARLEKEVPDAHGIRSGTLRGDVERLPTAFPATDPGLSVRAHAILNREGRPDIRLAMLNYFDPNHEIVDVLGEVCRKPADPSLIANAARHIAARQPERLLEAAGHVSRQKEKTRALFYAELKRAAPGWIERNGADLSNVLWAK